eukprot:751251-Hanusia_phi.AAC.5
MQADGTQRGWVREEVEKGDGGKRKVWEEGRRRRGGAFWGRSMNLCSMRGESLDVLLQPVSRPRLAINHTNKERRNFT